LLVACAAELGEEVPGAIGSDVFGHVSLPESTAMFQALGSPSSWAGIGPVAVAINPAVAITSEEQGPKEWLLRQQFKYGLEPFPEFCQYAMGLLRSSR
jgi:hypothetical protein